ncbi:MAG: elongation factor G [Christensenellales bacterium]
MKEYHTNSIRNIGLIGHGGEGKTTLAEAMLFLTGATDRMGRVEDGSTTMDYDSEEMKRQISISAAVAPVEYKNFKINLIDSPGYFDFVGEVVQALHLSDGAIILLSAVSGIAVGTEKAWEFCQKYDLPRMFFINNMDREHADYLKAVAQLKEKYGSHIAPIQLPIMQGEAMKGYMDIITMKAYAFDGKNVKDTSCPDDVQAHAEELREALLEVAAENDDALLEKYFAGEELTPEEIVTGLRAGVLAGKVAPVLCGSAAQRLGVTVLMDNIINYMPSLADRPARKALNTKTGQTVECKCDESAPFAAQVFKTVADPFVGKLSIFKIFAGALSSDMTMSNTNSGKSEKVGTLYLMRGKKQVPVEKLFAGDIGAVAKLQNTTTGDTLCDASLPLKFDTVTFPKPCISLAVTARKSGDEDKVFSGLYRLEEEDPTFKVEKQTDTGDTLISGMGELHLEVICRKLQNKFGVEAQLNEPKIPFKETIRKAVKAEGKHKKQTGGHGQFGHCWIEFEPIYDGPAFEFVDKVVGGVVPRSYIPAVEKGLREAIVKGVLAGYPVVNIRCTLYDGSFHPVDSSEMAFKIAARQAFKKGCLAANPVLLEPICKVQVYIPDEYMGDIIGDMNRRRGRIMGMNPADGLQQVVVEVPLAEMFKYATDLRSMTQARGTFDMEIIRYDEVPGNIAAKIIEQAKKEEDEDE